MFKLNDDIENCPEVLKIRCRLKGRADAYSVVGRLVSFWGYAAGHKDVISDMDAATIDELVQLDGFASSLESVGWLRFEDGNAIVIRPEIHRSKAAERQARYRGRKLAAKVVNEGPVQKPEQTPVQAVEASAAAVREAIQQENRPDSCQPETRQPISVIEYQPAPQTLPAAQPIETQPLPVKDFDLTPEGLAQQFCFAYIGPSRNERNPYAVAPVLKELIEHDGIRPEDIRARILDPARAKREFLWQFVKHFTDAKKADHHEEAMDEFWEAQATIEEKKRRWKEEEMREIAEAQERKFRRLSQHGPIVTRSPSESKTA